MNLYQYTAVNNTGGARSVIESYGGRPANHPMELAQQLAFCVTKDGQKALDKIASVHPDLQLIKDKVQSDVPLIQATHTHSNACGCSGSNFSGVDGQNAKAEVKSRLSDKTELLITGGIVLIGLAMVLKLMK